MQRVLAGSAWVTLSRPFVEYVIMGWENLPRLALMYFTNTVSSPEVSLGRRTVSFASAVAAYQGMAGPLSATGIRTRYTTSARSLVPPLSKLSYCPKEQAVSQGAGIVIEIIVDCRPKL